MGPNISGCDLAQEGEKENDEQVLHSKVLMEFLG